MCICGLRRGEEKGKGKERGIKKGEVWEGEKWDEGDEGVDGRSLCGMEVKGRKYKVKN